MFNTPHCLLPWHTGPGEYQSNVPPIIPNVKLVLHMTIFRGSRFYIVIKVCKKAYHFYASLRTLGSKIQTNEIGI